MVNRYARALAPALAVVAIGVPAGAIIVHDEGVNGDLSGNAAAPTALALALGTNSIIATSVRLDLEYVAVTVPAGLSLQSLVLSAYSGVDGTAFHAVQSGSVFTEPPSGTNVANLLGWSHFGPNVAPLGTDYLPLLAAGPGAIGFAPPLGSGTYTFWLQQTGLNAATYQFDFNVVPSPGVGAAALGLGALAALRRRRA